MWGCNESGSLTSCIVISVHISRKGPLQGKIFFSVFSPPQAITTRIDHLCLVQARRVEGTDFDGEGEIGGEGWDQGGSW